MSANDKQINGDHYRGAIQTWDYIVANDLGFLEGNIVKYVTRFRKKNGIQDLEKARHYLDKLIEVEDARLRRPPDSDRQVEETTTQRIAEARHRYGVRVAANANNRKPVADALPSRNETGYGQPKSIGDIT